MSSVVVTAKEKFLLFEKDEDSFMGSLMQCNVDYIGLWNVCWIIFVLSHDQADVERDFNNSGKFLFENMQELSLINQRINCYKLVICTITELIKRFCFAARGLSRSMAVT